MKLVSSEDQAGLVKKVRRRRARRLATRLLVGVGLPTLLALLYYGVLTTPRFESVSVFTIEAADNAVPVSALQMLMRSAGSPGQHLLLVERYIQSRDILRQLVADHRFRETYGNPAVDWVSRLPRDATFEDAYRYYRHYVRVVHDPQSGAVTLKVQAFEAEAAQRLAEAVLTLSESMTNRVNAESIQDRIRLAQAELTRAEDRLTKARQSLRSLQLQRSELNPLASAEVIMSVKSRLEGELAIARAELSTLRATAPQTSPEVAAARHRIFALERQIVRQTERLAGRGEAGISGELAEFEPVVIEKEFAQRAYESALASLEVARVDAARQHRYLVRVSGPSRPDQTSQPELWYEVFKVLILAFALMGIGSLLIASVREHANL